MVGTGRFELPRARQRLAPLAGLIWESALADSGIGALRVSATQTIAG